MSICRELRTEGAPPCPLVGASANVPVAHWRRSTKDAPIPPHERTPPLQPEDYFTSPTLTPEAVKKGYESEKKAKNQQQQQQQKGGGIEHPPDSGEEAPSLSCSSFSSLSSSCERENEKEVEEGVGKGDGGRARGDLVSYKGILLYSGLERVRFPDGLYTGFLDTNGHLAGYGKAEWTSGDVYAGEWLSDRMHGVGVYTWADGDYYSGDYVNGYMCGFGEMRDAGSVYTGDWVDDMREGKGRMVYANNDVYEGEWLAGMRHGRGKLVESNGNVYEGEFVRNEKEGKGILTSKNGDIYEGDFMAGEFNGNGMYMWADGAKYIGSFKNGLRHGEGREWHPDGEWIFGNFTYGKINQQHQVLQSSTTEDFVVSELPDNLEAVLEPLNPKQLRHLSSPGVKKEDESFSIESSDDFNESASNNVNPDNGNPVAISIGNEPKVVQGKVQQRSADPRVENDQTVYDNLEELTKEVDRQGLSQERPPRGSEAHSPLEFSQEISLPVFSPCRSSNNSRHTNLEAIPSISLGLPLRQRPLTDKDLQDWRQVKIIGKGSFGSVYEALLTCGRTVCCKVVHLGNTATREDLVKLKNEISLMKRIHHTNIVQYYGSLKNKDDNTLNIFMEFVSGGSLSGFVKKFKQIPYETMRQWTYQVVCGVRYLHSCGIVHRDIKGDNVLVSMEGIVKLADFGCSKYIDKCGTKDGCATMVGTPYWMAPEVIKCDAHGYGTKSDIWSIGCTIVEMLTGRPPWPECNSMWAAVYKIANSTGLPTEIPKDLDPQLMDLLEKCFERDPQKRASAEELLQHPFLAEVAKDPQQGSNMSR